MAAQDDLDDDIFADLYDADDAAAAPPAPKEQPAPVAAAPSASASTLAPAPVEAPQTHDTQMFEERPQYGHEQVDNHREEYGQHDGGAEDQGHKIGIKEDGKMFIGGLNWDTTDQSMRDYFSQFGEVVECTVMRDSTTGRSRGFGFLTFKDPKCVNIVMVKEHYLDGKIIDPKRAIPRDEQEKTSKIFVGGISQEASEEDFKQYFQQFGRVLDATLMIDKDTGRPRGFGFITFDNEATVDALLQRPLEIFGKPVEVKKAQPRGNVRERDDEPKGFNRQGGNRQFDGGQNQGGAPGGGAGGMYNGMSPQMMAQYWQRMQQYFAMMQQQLAVQQTGGGGAAAPNQMNPMMMMQQMQQMQAMQAQGRGQNPGDPAAQPNPAMMQQFQQMQQMQEQAQAQAQAQGEGSQMDGDGSEGSQGGFNRNAHHGFSAYEQHMFEQQKYGGGVASDPPRNMNNQAFGNSAWEGMYDDSPQANLGQQSGASGGRAGPWSSHYRGRGGRGGSSTPPISNAKAVGGTNTAAPPNAPTGPKNAGKPGANYRGGARGGGHRYHPYNR